MTVPFSEHFLAFLLIKMAVTAAIVVCASLIAERTGPLVAAMVATLPVSAGPVYAFLGMEHGSSFIAAAALGSMGSNMATTAFSLAYVLAAQRFTTMPALAAALAAWAVVIISMKLADLSFEALAIAVVLVFPVVHLLVRPYLFARPKVPPRLAWYAIPLRAAFVAVLVAMVTTFSFRIGALWSGFFATFPVVLSTLVIFVQPRIGGPATAAIISSGVLGLMGFALALGTVHLVVVPLGTWWGLTAGLAFCMVWNLALLAWARRGSFSGNRSPDKAVPSRDP